MKKAIRRELILPQPPEQVWQAIADSASLADWMYPNDFLPQVGHKFTFQVPPKPGFDGLTVHCEVLECDPPRNLVFSWSAGEITDTQVSFRLEPEGDGTKLFFEHTGFDVAQRFGKQAFAGAEYGWSMMLEQLVSVVARSASDRN